MDNAGRAPMQPMQRQPAGRSCRRVPALAAPLRGVRAAAFALAALALGVPGEAEAQTQTETTFISNIGRGNDRASSFRVTSFTTGAGPYLLSSVDLYSVNSSGVTPLVQIYEDNPANTEPGDWLVTLTNPGSIRDSAVNTFTDPANTPLESNTVYWLAVSNSALSTGTGFNIRTQRQHHRQQRSRGGMEHWHRLMERKHSPNVLDCHLLPHPIRDQGLRRNHAAAPRRDAGCAGRLGAEAGGHPRRRAVPADVRQLDEPGRDRYQYHRLQQSCQIPRRKRGRDQLLREGFQRPGQHRVGQCPRKHLYAVRRHRSADLLGALRRRRRGLPGG